MIAAAAGLHPTGDDGVTVIKGACVSLVNVIVWEAVPTLPHASVTVQVLVTENEQPDPTSGQSVNVAVRPVEQLSVTDAVPNAAVIAAAVGLHPTGDDAVTVITGACESLVKVIVWEAVPILPQASVTVQVLVTENEQPEPTSGPSVNVAVSPVEQLSVTDAVPKAAVIAAAAGLHPTGDDGVTVITGA